MEVEIMETQIPHGDVKVYDKNGNLLRVDSVVEHARKKWMDFNGFACKKCKHTLNLNLVCEKCEKKI
jgi:hypothetical protein